MGLTLLWYGSAQISVAGLVVMLIGLITAVSAAVPPRLSLPTSPRPHAHPNGGSASRPEAIDRTMHRADETAGRVRDSVGSAINRLMGLVHGVICAVQGIFGGRRSGETPAT